MHLVRAGKVRVRVRRDLVDMVAHSYRRFLVSWASQMGLPTIWKGDGRVRYRRLYMTWGPLKYMIELNAIVYCILYWLLKAAYASVWEAVHGSVQSE